MNQRRKLIIRADGSTQIGIGHIVRTIALAQMLSDDFEIHFFSIQIPYILRLQIIELGFNLVILESESEFLFRIDQYSIIVIDGYQFDEEYQKKIKNLGNKLVIIDDLCEGQYICDLIINHSPSARKENYFSQSFTKFALGLKYSLLRPAFIEIINKSKIKKEKLSLLIAFGGSDVQNITLKTLKILSVNTYHFQNIRVVLGPSYPYLDDLYDFMKDSNFQIELFYSLNEISMKELLEKSEFALVPSSGILFESLACKCKAISGYYVDNQKKVYEGFLRLGAIIDAKDFNDESLTSAFENISSKKEVTNIDYFQGDVKERFRNLFLLL